MKSDYERVNDIGRWKSVFLYSSTFVTFLLTADEKYKISYDYSVLKDYVQLVIAFNTILIALYILLEIRENYIFSKAEKNRRLQYLDNSFDTNFAGKRIENYFSQDKLNPGFYKLCVNCFENVYFSFNVAKQMQFGVYVKAVVVALIFIFSAAVGEKGIVRSIFEAILPLALIQNAIKLSIFVNRLDNLLENFHSFFSSLRGQSFINKEPEALKNVIAYETTLAWASLPLDSEIFGKMNKQLSKEWEEQKSQYQINNI